MSRGKRYNGEEKLNIKKVSAVAVTIIVIILLIVGLVQILKADKNTFATKNVELNYLPLFTNGNWGVINSSGEIIVEPANSEMVLIPNKAKPVFICTYEVNYVDGTFKTKAINDKNQQLFTEFDNVMVIQNYDDNNSLWFEENLLKVQKDGKYGLIDLNENVVLQCEYDSISAVKGVKNAILIKKENLVGIVNSAGTLILPAEYSEIRTISQDYKNGYIVKNTDSKYGVAKSDGQIILECKYDDIKNIVDNNKFIVKEANIWKVVAEDGTTYLEGKVANAVSMNNGDVIVNDKGKYGVLNIETDAKIPFEYEDLSYMFDDKYIAKKDGKYGVINTSNEIMINFIYSNMKYNSVTDYTKAQNENGSYDYITRDLLVKLTAGNEKVLNGFISVSLNGEIKYFNYKLEEKSNKDVYTANTMFVNKVDGKYGFTNKEGKVVIEAKYDDAREQNDYGYVAVKKDGKWGAIDQRGNVVVEPKYVLNNNDEIDFIGKWHSSVDSNANYYTDFQD